MGTVPVPWQMGANGIIPTTSFNAGIYGALIFALNPPLFMGRQTVAQTLTTGVWASITLDVEDVDTANGHSTSSNTSRYVAQYAGYHHVDAFVAFASNATGARGARLAVNGSVVNGRASFVAAVVTDRAAVPVSGTVYLNVGDYVEVQGFQTSGGNLNTDVSVTDLRSMMTTRWVSN